MDYTSMFLPCNVKSLNLTEMKLSDQNTYHSMYQMLYAMSNCEEIIGLNTIDTHGVTSVNYFFGGNSNFTIDELDLSGMDFSDVTVANNMFGFGSNSPITKLNISDIHFDSLSSASGMISGPFEEIDMTDTTFQAGADLSGLFDNLPYLHTLYCDSDWDAMGYTGSPFSTTCGADPTSGPLIGAVTFDNDSAHTGIEYANPNTGYFTGSDAPPRVNGLKVTFSNDSTGDGVVLFYRVFRYNNGLVNGPGDVPTIDLSTLAGKTCYIPISTEDADFYMFVSCGPDSYVSISNVEPVYDRSEVKGAGYTMQNDYSTSIESSGEFSGTNYPSLDTAGTTGATQVYLHYTYSSS